MSGTDSGRVSLFQGTIRAGPVGGYVEFPEQPLAILLAIGQITDQGLKWAILGTIEDLPLRPRHSGVMMTLRGGFCDG